MTLDEAKWYTEKIGRMACELHDAYDENETLRGMVLDMWEWRIGLPSKRVEEMRARMKDVGIEVE